MSVFCKVGVHKWVGLGQNMMFTDSVKQCKRCKVGSHSVSFGMGEIRYTSEAMAQAWREGKISNEEARALIYGSNAERANAKEE